MAAIGYSIGRDLKEAVKLFRWCSETDGPLLWNNCFKHWSRRVHILTKSSTADESTTSNESSRQLKPGTEPHKSQCCFRAVPVQFCDWLLWLTRVKDCHSACLSIDVVVVSEWLIQVTFKTWTWSPLSLVTSSGDEAENGWTVWVHSDPVWVHIDPVWVHSDLVWVTEVGSKWAERLIVHVNFTW